MDSSVFTRAEIIQASRTADWLVLTMSFLVFCGGFHVHAMLTMGDWDFWTDWKDRRLWPTVTPIMCITFPAAVQYWMWDKLRLPLGATFTILGLLFGEWVNRYFNFWGWTYFPINFVWAATLVPGAIILDVMLLWSKSFLITAVVGGLSFGLIFYPGNWSMLAVLHQPVEYNGMMMTIADIQGYHYVRTGTPEYIRFVEKGSLRTFGKDVVPVSAFFSGFICILIYFIWHFFGRWYSTTTFLDEEGIGWVGSSDGGEVRRNRETGIVAVAATGTLSYKLPQIWDLIRKNAGSAVTPEKASASAPKDDVVDLSVDPPPPGKPSFCFSLEGTPEATNGAQVKCSSDVALVFDSCYLLAGVYARIIGETLDVIRNKDSKLEISVIPRGFTLRGSPFYQIAEFRDGRLKNPVRFNLKAPDQPGTDFGVYVIFSQSGAGLYEFNLPIEVVRSLDADKPLQVKSPLDIDLDTILADRDRTQRTATVYIKLRTVPGSVFIVRKGHEPIDIPLNNLAALSFVDLLDATKSSLEPIHDDSIWNLTEDPVYGLPEEKQRWFLDLAASAGSSLYSQLSRNEGLKRTLKILNELPTSATIDIYSDSAFLPWEILYPTAYVSQWNEERKRNLLRPSEFWGYRFSIENHLMNFGVNTKEREILTGKHRDATLGLSVNLNPTIDQKLANYEFSLPVAAQIEWAEKHLMSMGVKVDVWSTGSAIKKMLEESDFQGTFIYLYCHGKSSTPNSEEQLELEGDDHVISPTFLDADLLFAGAPIIFLNSCSSGAFSPLSFCSFLEKFRDKQAVGLLATSFPVPATFAAGFGRNVIDKYVAGTSTLGDILLNLRRDLLHKGNPLGLFYTLQCPMDVVAPPLNRNARP